MAAIKNTTIDTDVIITTKSDLYLARKKSVIVTAFIFLAIIANFFPNTAKVKYPVGICAIDKNTHPKPCVYAVPGPPMKLPALRYVVTRVIASTNPPKSLPPVIYSSIKPFSPSDEALALLTNFIE